MLPTRDLPPPDDDERALSERLARQIRDEIAAGGPMPFRRFMQLALYAPGLGYYSAGKTKFGAAGDFVTAPELGELLGRSIARAVAPVLDAEHKVVLELGAGSGALAAALLDELERLGAVPPHYLVLETSAELRQRQRERLARFGARVAWLDAPPPAPWRGVLLGNEVVDALPVTLIECRDGAPYERRVALDAAGGFAFTAVPAAAALAALARARFGTALDGPGPYRAELLPELGAWFAAVAGTLETGVVLMIDYGDARREHYRPERRDGTLACHYRHRVHRDPLRWPGLQDITAAVDFTALAEAARDAGFEPAAYLTQSQFLIAAGVGAVLEAMASADPLAQWRLAAEAKRLMLPGEMGERFKVFGAVRGLDATRLCFADAGAAERLGLAS